MPNFDLFFLFSCFSFLLLIQDFYTNLIKSSTLYESTIHASLKFSLMQNFKNNIYHIFKHFSLVFATMMNEDGLDTDQGCSHAGMG